MKGPTPRRLRKYVAKCLGLKSYLHCPGDGRFRGRIPAAALLWALLMGVLLRRALDVSQRFGEDALGYFTERLDPAVTAVRHAERHKAFDDCRFIGLAVDGTSAGRSLQKACAGCRPYRNPQGRSSAIITNWS